ncbi:MAG: NfeD family protein [Chloroflexi bacterium]|nr:NfeD family protein [Chloroflexota bacterium]
MKSRLILALISSFLDEVLIVAIILWVLPQFGIRVPLPALIAILAAFTAFSLITFRLSSRVLARKPLPGLTDMVGMTGRVVRPLAPVGMVKIMGELWEAHSADGAIEISTHITVVSHRGLKLTVRRVTPEPEG